MKIENIKIDQLSPYVNNAKKHPKKQIDLLVENIKKFGFTTPVLISEKNEIIAGHGRVLALARLGINTVPCVRMEGLTEKEIKALRLADNKIAEMGEWDKAMVSLELQEIDDQFLIELSGFTLEDINTFEPVEEGDKLDEMSEGGEKKEHECPECGHVFTD